MLALSSLPFKTVKQTEYCVSNQHDNLSDFRSHQRYNCKQANTLVCHER